MECYMSNDGDPLDFRMVVCPDGYPYMTFEDDDGREPGFFFSVTGLNKANMNSLRFRFPLLSNQNKLISFGHKPVVLKVSSTEY